MQTHTGLDPAEAGLAGIGGEILVGSGFTDIAATPRED